MAECAFCLQDIADGEEFCPGVGCSGSYRLLFGKAEDDDHEDEPTIEAGDRLALDYHVSDKSICQPTASAGRCGVTNHRE